MEVYDSDLLLLEKIIKEKKEKLNESLTALNEIEERLKEGKKTVKNVKHECEEIFKNLLIIKQLKRTLNPYIQDSMKVI